MKTLVPVLTTALFLTFAAACAGSPEAGPDAEPSSVAESGPKATPDAPTPPDELLEALSQFAATSALFAGQQARMIFGCARLGEPVCLVPAGRLGPQMTRRVVDSLGEAAFEQVENQTLQFLCAKAQGAWSCTVSYGELPSTYAVEPSVISD